MKNIPKYTAGLLYGLSLALLSGTAAAHGIAGAGQPVCLEGNYMVADAMNTPFASAAGPGRVLEMNIITGERGITVNGPFNSGNEGTPICPDGVACPGPWKPTGVLSGGQNGHAYITSAAQHALTEFHRDGTPIRTVKLPMDDDPRFGTVPRLLGTQVMPNGNLIQTVCDANFFNAVNSDPIEEGEPDPKGDGNSSNLYFPPVYSTPERAANSRLLVLDQETLEVIDEYSIPDEGELGHDLWGCMAGIIFSDEGMFVSTFHTAAVLVIDWKAGLDNEKSEGVGSNRKDVGDDDSDDSVDEFKLGSPKNRAVVTRVIDMLPGLAADDPMRRDSLRAITFDEAGNLYATFRMRSRACLRGEYAGAEGGCNPGVFRQHIAIVPNGENSPTQTIALDPGINVIAGIRTNRMSGPGCAEMQARFPGDGDVCDVETLMVAASAFNPGCVNTGPIGANPCFVPGGGVGEYLISAGDTDATDGTCSGDPAGDNSGCALPIATFKILDGNGDEEKIDPRMLMVIHEAFVQ